MPNLTPIIDERRFILATRDTGYRSTASAISELVDNAIQAGANIVRIFVTQEGVGSDKEFSVAVLDNGCGMDRPTLQQAMQFAGSSRFDDRTGLGRFGMGLPNSSVSQARRLDVFTWQDRDKIIHSYLDIDQITSGKQVGVPQPRPAELPGWAAKYVRKRTGTLIEWSNCDRLDNRKASTIADKLRRPLGQRFRYFLWEGNKIYVNNELVIPFDPLYLDLEEDLTPAKPFGDTLTVEFRTPADPTVTSTVCVRFSELPVGDWHSLTVEEKRYLGVAKGAGVSVVRAGREIDTGWYFMGGKRKENYDDWWRCEICFDPELDELFGVTHSKQEINPTELLRAELSQHLEAIAQTLNSRVRSAFALIRQQQERPPTTAEAKASEREPFLPPAVALDGYISRSQLKPAKRLAPKELDRPKFRIQPTDLDLPDAYVWERNAKGHILVKVNRNHSFYEHIYSQTHDAGETLRDGVESILLALVRAEIATAGDEASARIVGEFRLSFGNILAAYLGD